MIKKIQKITVLFLLILTLTGCTKSLKDDDGKVVKNETTGQTITENIICKPTNEETKQIYEENNIDISSLPECDEISLTSDYEGIWNNLFIKPLAKGIVYLGSIVGNVAVSIIILTIILRAVLFPLSKKSILQSQNLKKAQPELKQLEKKYENKKDPESVQNKSKDMMVIYKKYDINPVAGCVFAFIQMPIIFAFFEAINRTPAIFEGTFLGFQLGTNPSTAIMAGNWGYIIFCILIVGSTYFSFKMNEASMSTNSSMPNQGKMMAIFMTVFIGFISFTLPTAIAFYWITSSVFTILQNIYTKRKYKK